MMEALKKKISAKTVLMGAAIIRVALYVILKLTGYGPRFYNKENLFAGTVILVFIYATGAFFRAIPIMAMYWGYKGKNTAVMLLSTVLHATFFIWTVFAFLGIAISLDGEKETFVVGDLIMHCITQVFLIVTFIYFMKKRKNKKQNRNQLNQFYTINEAFATITFINKLYHYL